MNEMPIDYDEITRHDLTEDGFVSEQKFGGRMGYYISKLINEGNYEAGSQKLYAEADRLVRAEIEEVKANLLNLFKNPNQSGGKSKKRNPKLCKSRKRKSTNTKSKKRRTKCKSKNSLRKI